MHLKKLISRAISRLGSQPEAVLSGAISGCIDAEAENLPTKKHPFEQPSDHKSDKQGVSVRLLPLTCIFCLEEVNGKDKAGQHAASQWQQVRLGDTQDSSYLTQGQDTCSMDERTEGWMNGCMTESLSACMND